MANFSTHITVAAAGAGLLSVLCLQVGLVGSREALLLALLGTIGGILPDIDLQHAYPSRIMFSLFGILVAFLLVFAKKSELSIVELWGIGLTVFAVIRFPVWMVFHQYTTHRGSIHSLVAALLFMFLTTAFAYHVMGEHPFMSWLFGLFVFLGFVLHLLLDELYSVDFMNTRIKKSFGTALKILDWKNRGKSTLLVVATILAWAVVPDSRSFWDTLLSAETYHIIGSRFLP
ncbi:MAG: metal-dependent hydrolase [Thiothrix sp.]